MRDRERQRQTERETERQRHTERDERELIPHKEVCLFLILRIPTVAP